MGRKVDVNRDYINEEYVNEGLSLYSTFDFDQRPRSIIVYILIKSF